MRQWDVHMKMYVKIILLNDQGLPFMGKGPRQLLRGIERLGSINQAAKEMHLSYMKALKIIKKMEICLGGKILETKIGGKNHGGSALTPLARQFLEIFSAYEARVTNYAEKHFAVVHQRVEALKQDRSQPSVDAH